MEAIAERDDGHIIGWQAKYFCSVKYISWSQIDKSVEAALNAYPELDHYIIALPCDLTGRSGAKGQGKNGWEHWKNRVKNWQALVRQKGHIPVQFEVWTKDELFERLSRPDAVGLRHYWFNAVEMSDDWFRKQVHREVETLDDRYHPEDHVDVEAQALFDVMVRHPRAFLEFNHHVNLIGACAPRINRLAQGIVDMYGVFDFWNAAIADFRRLKPCFEGPLSDDWPLDELLSTLALIFRADHFLEKWIQQIRSLGWVEEGIESELLLSIGIHETSAKFVQHALRSLSLAAENDRFAILTGHAGTGKSQLMAEMASRSVDEGHPALFIAGQRWTNQNLWTQLANHVGFPGQDGRAVLAALDAAGEKTGVRALLLIDAINEGIGCQYWRNWLGELRSELAALPHIACVVSCRSEYLDFAEPKSGFACQKVPLHGFQTEEEREQAAQIFLDKRGIVRPALPWLSPEFSNPLFLRTVCTALQQQHLSEFPAQMSGARAIVQLYLDSAGRSLSHDEQSAVPLSALLGQALRSLARRMVEQRCDYVVFPEATGIIDKEFGGIAPRLGSSWLAVLLERSLLRRDPHPHQHSGTSLSAPEEVVRFSFQRFQDYVMAEELVAQIDTIDGAFGEGGALEFCLMVDWFVPQWHGLVDALAVILPETCEAELIDLLPGGIDRWCNSEEAVNVFAESAIWRSRAGFTKRTTQILQSFANYHLDAWALLVRVAVLADHPWNTRFLHDILTRWPMPERDSEWTIWVNDFASIGENSLNDLINWCLSTDVNRAGAENRRLAALCLGWALTASNRKVRDRATKALTALMVIDPKLFGDLIKAFEKVDDIYIHERILAAAYGACCREASSYHLSAAALCAYNAVFADGKPVPHLLLRDYALGILECAQAHKALPSSIDIAKCRPPFNSLPPDFNLQQADVEAIAAAAGNDRILYSTTPHRSDFGTYEIAPAVRDFLAISLNEPVPLTKEERLARFERECVALSAERIKWFLQIKIHVRHSQFAVTLNSFSADQPDQVINYGAEETEQGVAGRDARFKQADRAFRKLLSPDEVAAYEDDGLAVLRSANSSEEENRPEFDARQAGLWVAKRAYELGWANELFPEDRSGPSELDQNRPPVERIGKKYQWIAHHEMMARLADNFWLENRYDGGPKPFEAIQDIDFIRDIDPTIICSSLPKADFQQSHNVWAAVPAVSAHRVDDNDLEQWAKGLDLRDELKSLPIRTDASGTSWLVLSEHQSETLRDDAAGSRSFDYRQQEFRLFHTVCVKKADVQSIVNALVERAQIDVMDWDPLQQTNTGFLWEAPWRNTWPQKMWFDETFHLPDRAELAFSLMRYHWESNEDLSFDDGARSHLPSPWLAKKLKLSRVDDGPNWVDQNGKVGFQSFSGQEWGGISLVRKDLIDDFLDSEWTVLSVLVAERNASPTNQPGARFGSRFEGVCWLHEKRWLGKSWRR